VATTRNLACSACGWTIDADDAVTRRLSAGLVASALWIAEQRAEHAREMAPIHAALALLAPDDRPDIRSIQVARLDDGCNAKVRLRDGRIHVNQRGDSYQRAVDGDARFLAASLAHENFHFTQQSLDETAARAVSVRVLRELGVRIKP